MVLSVLVLLVPESKPKRADNLSYYLFIFLYSICLLYQARLNVILVPPTLRWVLEYKAKNISPVMGSDLYLVIGVYSISLV